MNRLRVHGFAYPHRKGVHGRKPSLDRPWPEAGPGTANPQVAVDHRLPSAEGVEAGALLVLDLEQLQQVGPLARRGDHVEGAVDIGEQDGV